MSKVCSDTTQLYNLESEFRKNREGTRSRAVRSLIRAFHLGFVPRWAFTLPWLLHLTLDLFCHQTCLLITGLLSRPGYCRWTCCALIQVLWDWTLVREVAACLPHCYPGSPSLPRHPAPWHTWHFTMAIPSVCSTAPVYQLMWTAQH